MSKRDDAMLKRMRHIVFDQKRSFSFRDFLKFEDDGKEYTMTHQVYRNKISKLKKKGIVENEYTSSIAFHTLAGYKFFKARGMMTPFPVTPTHTVGSPCLSPVIKYKVSSKSSCDVSTRNVDNVKTESNGSNQSQLNDEIKGLPLGQKSIHDIRLRFEIPDVWAILSRSISTSPQLKMNSNSQDIVLPILNTEGLQIRTTVHKTDTISVILACSAAPVASDIGGVFRLSKALTRVEERISRIIDETGRTLEGDHESLPVPECDRWLVVMWHFGIDSIEEYAGKAFCITWDDAENNLIRAYTKNDLVVSEDGSKRPGIRLEKQEYPRKSLAEAIAEKLKQ